MISDQNIINQIRIDQIPSNQISSYKHPIKLYQATCRVFACTGCRQYRLSSDKTLWRVISKAGNRTADFSALSARINSRAGSYYDVLRHQFPIRDRNCALYVWPHSVVWCVDCRPSCCWFKPICVSDLGIIDFAELDENDEFSDGNTSQDIWFTTAVLEEHFYT